MQMHPASGLLLQFQLRLADFKHKGKAYNLPQYPHSMRLRSKDTLTSVRVADMLRSSCS